MDLGKRHVATGLVVVIAHLWVMHLFGQVGGGQGDRAETPAMDVGLVDGFATPQLTPKPIPMVAPADDPPQSKPPEPLAPPPPDPISALVEALVVAELPAAPFDPSPPAETAQAAPAASSASVQCQTTENLQAALQAAPEVQDAVRRIPRTARSVANAVKVWDQAWSPPDALGGRLDDDPVRAVALAVIAATPVACLDQPVAGPRLVMLIGPDTTTIMAFGSGVWRWRDLIPPPSPLDAVRRLFADFPELSASGKETAP